MTYMGRRGCLLGWRWGARSRAQMSCGRNGRASKHGRCASLSIQLASQGNPLTAQCIAQLPHEADWDCMHWIGAAHD